MRKVLVVDSGVGGLNVLDRLVELRRDIDYIYFADEGYCPYGTRTADEVVQRVTGICRVFANVVDGVVLACNTASVCMQGTNGKNAFSDLQARFADNVEVITTIQPTVESAQVATETDKICLLATKLCIETDVYRNLFAKYGVECKAIDCGAFVTLAEKHAPVEVCRDVVRRTLDNSAYLYKGADTVVLGCTHFDYVADVVRDYFASSDVRLVSSSVATANFAAEILPRHTDGQGHVEYLMSGNFAYVSTICRQTGRNFKLFDI